MLVGQQYMVGYGCMRLDILAMVTMMSFAICLFFSFQSLPSVLPTVCDLKDFGSHWKQCDKLFESSVIICCCETQLDIICAFKMQRHNF